MLLTGLRKSGSGFAASQKVNPIRRKEVIRLKFLGRTKLTLASLTLSSQSLILSVPSSFFATSFF